MAAPQTHFVLSFFIRSILSFVFRVGFSAYEILSIYVWGFLIDIDHFGSWNYLKDIIFVRIPRLVKGGDAGPPSDGVKGPPPWLHLWPGLVLVISWTWLFKKVDASFKVWIPFLFWFVHVAVDRFQKTVNEGTLHIPFLYPVLKGEIFVARGYPVKTRAELLISTILFLPFFILEVVLLIR